MCPNLYYACNKKDHFEIKNNFNSLTIYFIITIIANIMDSVMILRKKSAENFVAHHSVAMIGIFYMYHPSQNIYTLYQYSRLLAQQGIPE